MPNLPSLKKACIPEFNTTICKDAEISVNYAEELFKLCQ